MNHWMDFSCRPMHLNDVSQVTCHIFWDRLKLPHLEHVYIKLHCTLTREGISMNIDFPSPEICFWISKHVKKWCFTQTLFPNIFCFNPARWSTFPTRFVEFWPQLALLNPDGARLMGLPGGQRLPWMRLGQKTRLTLLHLKPLSFSYLNLEPLNRFSS